jgi:hypothetical protein
MVKLYTIEQLRSILEPQVFADVVMKRYIEKREEEYARTHPEESKRFNQQMRDPSAMEHIRRYLQQVDISGFKPADIPNDFVDYVKIDSNGEDVHYELV